MTPSAAIKMFSLSSQVSTIQIRIDMRTLLCAAGRSNVLSMPAASRKPYSPALSLQFAQLPCT